MESRAWICIATAAALTGASHCKGGLINYRGGEEGGGGRGVVSKCAFLTRLCHAMEVYDTAREGEEEESGGEVGGI